jgi:hypothetical protein
MLFESDDARNRLFNILVHRHSPMSKPAGGVNGKAYARLLRPAYSGLDWLLSFRFERLAMSRLP